MARTIRNQKLDTRSARTKLTARREPYWVTLSMGKSLGYRRLGAQGGTWVARAYDPATRSRRLEALGTADDALDADGQEVLTFAQAQERARAWFPTAFTDNATDLGAAAPLTVADAIEEYLEWLRAHRKPSTYAQSRSAALLHILPKLGQVRLASLTTGMVRAWFEAIAAKPAMSRLRRNGSRGLRPLVGEDAKRARRATANRLRTILVAALSRAAEAHPGSVAPPAMWLQVRPFRGVDAARLRYLSKQEIARLLNACAPDFRRLVRGALMTGCRYGELCRLEVRDLDVDAGTLTIREAKAGRPRHIPLDAEGREFFGAMTARRRGDERLFLRADGRPWATAHQQRPIADASVAAKLDTPATFHCLRHTFASLRVMAGAPLMAVASVLGHSDTRMVEKHYGHLAPSWIRDVMQSTTLGIGIGEEAERIERLEVG